MPFVQHVASAGAVVRDLGSSHGMRAIAARSGDQFMLFQVTPDGQAAVSGATVELLPAQLETIASGNITGLGVQHGLQGFFVRSGAQFQVFYATPDNERLIPGVLWDAAGKDLTRQQVARIPGAIHADRPAVHLFGPRFTDAAPLCRKWASAGRRHPVIRP
jgi:thiol:disulfide interchange protein DsbG